ncbi:MAG: ABC transporter permease subunit [Gemmatimonadetes bacterium]|nr:ABC transporter permease subunit [Gemmatimonadota bacterium]MCA9762742.1 ABC transporter permease subunit [Gemmatimonadota bacterium]MCB9504999.1 ABC transporter permease subunit [Gemmatimonadales bacterium]HPF62298.1 ABC transporter permease subunit [Gemmatimonadales bacterium]HRX17576.1 ABC transporter permease subunit [Gemmatimonadales bacterium]
MTPALLPLVRPALREALRGRWLLGLMLGLMLVGELLLRFGGGGPTTLVSMLDVVLILTPLVGLVFGTLQLHHGREFTELLLAQPVRRTRLFAVLYLGAAVPLAAALAVGVLAPFAWHGNLGGAGAGRVLALAGAAVVLALVSTALAFVIALAADDRVRALGLALALWLVAAVLWDGLLLLVAMGFGNRPIEVPLLVLLGLNPIDLTRVLLLLGTDAAALLGYTGALAQRVLGDAAGRAVLGVLLTGWLVVPLVAARRAFVRKDF